MVLIFGTLAINLPELTSLLNPITCGYFWPDSRNPNQAGHAATNFIVNVRHLSDGPCGRNRNSKHNRDATRHYHDGYQCREPSWSTP